MYYSLINTYWTDTTKPRLAVTLC